jgi:hypothetical protein
MGKPALVANALGLVGKTGTPWRDDEIGLTLDDFENWCEPRGFVSSVRVGCVVVFSRRKNKMTISKQEAARAKNMRVLRFMLTQRTMKGRRRLGKTIHE